MDVDASGFCKNRNPAMWELRDLRIFLQDLEQTPRRVIHDDIRFVQEGLDLLARNRISWSFYSLTNAALVFLSFFSSEIHHSP